MTLPDLQPIDTMRGGDPLLTRDELLHYITWGANNHPRSLQQAIGPSEVGTPCDRKLGFKLANTPPTGRPKLAWRTIVGTAVHAWLCDTFLAANIELGYDRWLPEYTVDVGEIDGINILGHCDIYDRVTCTVVDWKVVGVTTLRSARANGPTPTYETQGHLYGRGWARQGLPVDRVAIFYLPAAGEITEAVYWHADYDEAKAIAALQRAEKIKQAQAIAGAELVNSQLAIAEDYCVSCPWFAPGSEAPNTCDGAMQTKRDSLESLIVTPSGKESR